MSVIKLQDEKLKRFLQTYSISIIGPIKETDDGLAYRLKLSRGRTAVQVTLKKETLGESKAFSKWAEGLTDLFNKLSKFKA